MRKKKTKSKSSRKAKASPKSEKQGAVKREMTIRAIENGTVMDHIPTDVTFKVIDILNLQSYNDEISIATNLDSSKIGKKGIIKVEGKYLTEHEFNKISIVAPDATISIIKNFQVKDKLKVKIPDFIENVVKCSNPVCITNNEEVRTKFYITKKAQLKVKCHYCEREMIKDEIKII